MFLKSIEMTGFKSFPDKIDLTFPRGVTCVVGPNGSGKSNISDALRWVMGEQSAKTLRGGKMEDVIFSGTLKRKPLGFCEVSLVVDNSDRALPMDYDEITVTRRIFRSGDCEYYINRASCRLKDIHELFMDTGLGKDGYSLVGQGKIDEIISGRPQDRRTFFEEACGISKYHHKKNDAERKLNATNNNLTRINDIVSELEDRLEPLRQQSEKATKYLELREKLKVLQVNLWLSDYEKFKILSEKAEDEYLKSAVALDKMKTELEETDSELETLASEIASLRDRVDAYTQMCYNSEYDIKTFENQIEIAKNNIDHCNFDIDRITNELNHITLRYESIIKEEEKYAANLSVYADRKANLISEQTNLENELAQITSKLTERNSQMAEKNSLLLEKRNELVNLNVKKGSYISYNETLSERIAKLDVSVCEKRKSIDASEKEAEKDRELLDNTESEENSVKAEISEKEKEITALVHKATAINKEIQELENEKKRLSERLEMLKEAENSYLSYPKGIKEVMEADLPGVKLFGTLASLIKTDGKYADAIDGALGGKLGNIVCESEDDAKKAINFLKKTRAGRVTFLPVSSVKPKEGTVEDLSKEKGYVGIASDLITCDAKFKKVVEALLNQTYVFTDMDTAVAASRKYRQSVKIATLGGEIFSKGGSVTGGELRVKGAMKRLNEIKELEEKLENIPVLLSEKQKEEEKNSLSLSEEKEKLRLLNEKKNSLNEKKVNLLSEINYYLEIKASYEKDLSELNEETAETKERIDSNKAEIEAIEKDIRRKSEDVDAFEREILTESSDMGSVTAERDRVISELERVKLDIAALDKDATFEKERLDKTLAEKNAVEKEIKEKNSELNKINGKIKDYTEEIGFRNDQIAGLKETINQYNKEIEAARKGCTERQKLSEEKQQASKTIRDDYLKKSDENARLEMKSEKIKNDIEGIVSGLWDTYELTLTGAEELKCDIGPHDEASREAASLKGKIRALGNINLDAIEEYKEVNERYTFLTSQRNDLEEAKEELMGIINDMMTKMKTIFKTQFELISASFNETYIELFGGGMAKLSLSDPENVLESGIEIEVQPPGKKLTVISLLSGGEKAFTAIALLFSIIKIKPTPFCLFDEIEAALDDVNVYKYAAFLEKYKENTQFIVISHRRGTMEAADTLYGVTMQEKGVSKLLKLNIDEVEDK